MSRGTGNYRDSCIRSSTINDKLIESGGIQVHEDITDQELDIQSIKDERES